MYSIGTFFMNFLWLRDFKLNKDQIDPMIHVPQHKTCDYTFLYNKWLSHYPVPTLKSCTINFESPYAPQIHENRKEVS